MGSERRTEPRYTRRVEAHVERLQLHTANVSVNGAQLVCPKPSFSRFGATMGALIEVRFALPDGERATATARVAYVSDGGDDVLIGTRLEHFTANGGSHWAAYIARLTASSN